MTPEQELIGLLEQAVGDSARRLECVRCFQERVWAGVDLPADPDVVATFSDLAYDLEFYEPDSQVRAEDPALYGDARCLDEIRSALHRLHLVK